MLYLNSHEWMINKNIKTNIYRSVSYKGIEYGVLDKIIPKEYIIVLLAINGSVILKLNFKIYL